MAKKKAAKKKAAGAKKSVETITHADDKRSNIPTAEMASVVSKADKAPVKLRYPRNTDLDPQLVWKGKDEQDESDLVVNAPPLYIQEKVHPKVLIDDLLKQTQDQEGRGQQTQLDLFGDFNGLPDSDAKTEFYQHEANWTNRMILGDSLQVMASLAEREGLRGKVQCIYIDPPYGIKFNSNFQWSTNNKDVKDGKSDHITREPEQVKAFRDTWRDGIHSYLTYLRDRLTVARDLLNESGSVFVQIGDENVHRVRVLMDEVFGEENHVSTIGFVKTAGATSAYISSTFDYLIWFAKNRSQLKFRPLLREKSHTSQGAAEYVYCLDEGGSIRRMTKEELADSKTARKSMRIQIVTSQTGGSTTQFPFEFNGKEYVPPGTRGWSTSRTGMQRLKQAGRLHTRETSLNYIRFLADFPALPLGNMWEDTAIAGWSEDKRYVVQTARRVIERCLLLSTDPGDLVLDPTCGAGTTAFVAEQWGRRWITVDTSRVALALARTRLMGARYPYYLLTDSREGQVKSAEITRTVVSDAPTHGNIRHGLVYGQIPHIMLRDITSNAEIDVIWEQFQEKLEPFRKDLNKALKQKWEEWEIPREAEEDWSDAVKKLHADWWKLRIERQQEIDASIAAKAEFEYLYDRPYEDKSKVRVAGPFTVESLSPHRVLGVDENDELIDEHNPKRQQATDSTDFAQIMLDNLKTSGVQQSAKEDRITFTSITGWPGMYVCASGTYTEGESDDTEKKAGIFIGPEFGTVSKSDLTAAARECGDAGFDVLIACAFNFDAHSSDFNKLGPIPVLKARMNADLYMADDLKNTGKGNLFVIFGEPDIEIRESKLQGHLGEWEVQIHGVDVFKPQTGEVESSNTDGIACWFIDTDYNEESFFVRHAYFLGAGDPYKSLKTTLKAEINEEAWESLNSDTSRPFEKPKSGRIAVKVINHLGDEVMKVFRVE